MSKKYNSNQNINLQDIKNKGKLITKLNKVNTLNIKANTNLQTISTPNHQITITV